MPYLLKIAVCICQEVTVADFMLPMELFGHLNFADHPIRKHMGDDVPSRVQIEYLAPTMDLVFGFTPGLPGMQPTRTYADALEKDEVYDIIWVPAGPIPDLTTMEDRTPKEVIEFVKIQAPKVKYIMSVCGGAAILALAGVLDSKRATTNKAFYNVIKTICRDKNVTWVPKARWVVDGNIWTSSGVTAGTDMALAFLEELIGAKATEAICAAVEIAQRNTAEDDPFAAVHGLI
ncbi:hypothetical protein M422DRAFT_28095 [Sphaerobolus stellatus SS14]|nr:hypothetical protein M422DRAFT_28095 [Sphaerobolus stellatus SS14]